MISETSEDSTSEAKELPGICKRNLGHQAVVQPETLKLKRYILKPNSSIVTTLHGQHWSTLVNDMHSAQRKSCKELQIGGCWSSSKAGADTSCISWRAWSSMTIPHQHYTQRHAIIFKSIKFIPRLSKIPVTSMARYSKRTQHSIDTSSEAAALSSWLISWDSLQHLQHDPWLVDPWLVGLVGLVGQPGQVAGCHRATCTTSARHLHDICAMPRPLRFFWQRAPRWPRPAKAGQGDRPESTSCKNHGYGVDRCTLGTWRPLCAKCSTGSSNLSAGMEVSGRAYPRNSKVQMQKRYKPIINRSNHLPPTAARERSKLYLLKINFFWPTKSFALIRVESWLRT